MKTIYKYTITRRPIEIHTNAVILHVDLQDQSYCLWALVDTTNPLEQRQFDVVGTGWDYEDNMHYVGTILENAFVWHVVEIK